MTLETGNAVKALRLTSKAEQDLLNRLDSAGAKASPLVERRAPRVPFRTDIPVIVEVSSPSGGEKRFCVLPRNLSVGGFAFVHGQFLHFPQECIVHLPALTGKMVPVPGKAINCRHVSGLIHEVAVKFHAEIDVGRFVKEDGQVAQMADVEVAAKGTEKRAAPSSATYGTDLCTSLLAERQMIVLGSPQVVARLAALLGTDTFTPIHGGDGRLLLDAVRNHLGKELGVFELPAGKASAT